MSDAIIENLAQAIKSESATAAATDNTLRVDSTQDSKTESVADTLRVPDSMPIGTQDKADSALATDSSKAHWLDSMSEDLRNNQSLSKFDNYEALAKKYIELEGDLEKRISLPTVDSSDEEWQKLFSKLGMPENKKYISDQQKAELIQQNLADSDSLNIYEDLFHKGNLTKRQSDRLLKQIIANVENSNKHHIETHKKIRESNFEKFQTQHGDAANEKLNILKATMQKHGSDELVSLVEESNYSPILIDLLLKLGDKSDTLISGKSEKNIAGKAEALKEIKRLESDDGFMSKYSNKNHAGYEQAIENMSRLYDLAYNK